MPSHADAIWEVLRELQIEIDHAPDAGARTRLEAEATVLRAAFANAVDRQVPTDDAPMRAPTDALELA